MEFAIHSEPLKISHKQFEEQTDESLMLQANVEVLGDNQTIDLDRLCLDRDAIDEKLLNQPQRLPVLYKVDRQHTTVAGYLNLTLTKKPIGKIITWSVIACGLVGGGLMLHQHHVNQANQAAQSSLQSQINDQHSTNQHLTHKLTKDEQLLAVLKQQVKDLKSAVDQYQHDQNQTQFDQQLNQIQQRLDQVEADNQQLKILITKLQEAITELSKATPQQVQQIMDRYHFN